LILYLHSFIVSPMTTILPVASGKGGVGKSAFVANIGVSLAKQGKTVLLIDLDLGGSNLHTFLGLSNKHDGIGNYIYEKDSSLESLIVPTGIDRLYFISGDSLLPGTANLQYFVKKKIIGEMKNLIADFIILDLGAGASYNTIDFFLVTSKGLLVTTPETTSILNAYSFLKSSLYRLIYRSYPPDSDERTCVYDFITDRIEGTDTSFRTLIERLGEIKPESGETAERQLRGLFPRVVLNMGRSSQDIALGSKLREIVWKNLGLSMEYIGFIGYDEIIRKSIFERTPTLMGHPDSPFAEAVDRIGRKLITMPSPKHPALFEADEDLKELAEESSLTDLV
jgi:flagellar biosynthesis protein FlhG